jgi:hypothetical protein
MRLLKDGAKIFQKNLHTIFSYAIIQTFLKIIFNAFNYLRYNQLIHDDNFDGKLMRV